MKDYRTELNQAITQISDYYFIDPEFRKIGEKRLTHWNNSLMVLTYALNRNALIVGEPGGGKTTSMKVASSLLSGYPYDLYEAAQIEGHPDQTFDTMIARVDLAKLRKKEEVIWLLCAYLPSRLINEINRLPSGKQDEILEPLETGRFNRLNATFYTGRTPFYATANHPDDGNHALINPLRDRFAVHVELGYIGATYEEDIALAEENIRNDLCDAELTTRIINIINDPKLNVEQRLEKIAETRQDYVQHIIQASGVTSLETEDRREITRTIRRIPLSEDASMFSQMLHANLNTTPTSGRKRSCDKIDSSNHAQGLASTKAKNAASYRASSTLQDYAKGLAFLLGDIQVEKEHLFAVAPAILGHRLDFTDDFASEWQDKPRTSESYLGMPFPDFLSQQLVRQVEVQYFGDGKLNPGAKSRICMLSAALKTPQELTTEQRQEVREMWNAYEAGRESSTLDHPLMRELLHRMVNEGTPEQIAARKRRLG